MSAPEVDKQGQNLEQMVPKTPRSENQMAQAGIRNQIDGGNARSTSSFF